MGYETQKVLHPRCTEMTRRWMMLILMLGLAQILPAAKLGFAFSGGGARGFANIGILKVFEEYGIRPDCISGTSIGAFLGGLYAMGYDANELEDITLKLNWTMLFDEKQERQDLYIGQKRWKPYGNTVFEIDDEWRMQYPRGIFNGNNINLELARIFAPASGITDFSDLAIPFSCVATDLITGESRVFTSGSMMQVIRASISIPSIVMPFNIDGHSYIDGGIGFNIPIEQVRDLGADYVVGFKTNSPLRPLERLNSLFTILDQTINIGMTRNVEAQVSDCDLVMVPELDAYSATDFRQIRHIIDAGEAYGRSVIDSLLIANPWLLDQSRPKPQAYLYPLHRIYINEITVRGNLHISSTKIKEYIELRPKRLYTVEEIISACRSGWNSQLFQTIYPMFEPDKDGYRLIIVVKERQRKTLAVNLNYTSMDGMVAGVVLSLSNYLMRNSLALAEVKVGDKNELNLDFVKNFGDFWGIYYRIFPYINEKTLYFYNDDHQRTNSVRSMELGFTSGIGVFVRRFAVAEAYVYSFRTNLYRDVSNTEPIKPVTVISGLGFKAYHESVDDYLFPTSGFRFTTRLNAASDRSISDKRYGRFQFKGEAYLPVFERVSACLLLDYGSFFDREDGTGIDPFYFGGIDGFLGLQKYEKSAPFYQVGQISLTTEPVNDLFVQCGVQGLNYASREIWPIDEDPSWCVFAGTGYNTVVGPIRLMVAMTDGANFNYYLSIGFDTDIFKFSRR